MNSARLVSVGSMPRGTGALNVYQMEQGLLKPTIEVLTLWRGGGGVGGVSVSVCMCVCVCMCVGCVVALLLVDSSISFEIQGGESTQL